VNPIREEHLKTCAAGKGITKAPRPGSPEGLKKVAPNVAWGTAALRVLQTGPVWEAGTDHKEEKIIKKGEGEGG